MTGSTQWLGWNSPETKSDWRSLDNWARPHTKIYRSANVLTAFVSDLSSISSWRWQSYEDHVVCNSVPSWSKHHGTSSRLSKYYVYLYTESTAPGNESLHPLKWSSLYMATLLLPQSWSQWMAPPSELEIGVTLHRPFYSHLYVSPTKNAMDCTPWTSLESIQFSSTVHHCLRSCGH